MDLLTADEEVALGRRSQTGDLAARNELVNRNIGLVIKLRGYYRSRCRCKDEDLFQAGMLGLIQGANRFNPDAHPGSRFKSIAREYISKEMRSYLYARPLIPVPHSARQSELEKRAEPKGAKAKATRKLIVQSAAIANRPISQGESYMEELESPTEFAGDLLDLPGILDKLNPIESDVILRRYGFVDGKKQSLRSLSRTFGLNLVAVTDIEHRALSKIKHELTKESP